MKKINYYIVFFCSLLMIFQGCTLESEEFKSITPSIEFPANEADVSALITANVYGTFRNNGYNGMFNIANGVLLVSDLMSDYGECSWRGWAPLLYGRWLAGNGEIDLQWRYVKDLSKMTLTMERIKDVPMDEELKARYMAEARCGRGFLVFSMYDLYGPIPIADLETLQNPLNETIVPRATEEEMYTFIETELKEAAKVLPYTYSKESSEYGRFTKGLCHMVLLKFYMLHKEWDKAEEMGRELMKPEYGYDLVPEYKDIFTLANEKNEETIWAINCLPGYQEHKWHPHVLPNDYPTEPSHVVKWNGWKMTWAFFHTFEDGDKRKERIIYEYRGVPSDEYPDGLLHNEALDVPSGEKLQFGAVPFKYDIDPATTGEDNQIDWIIYRYADALTLLSEAIVRQVGITQEAINLLNKVRTRAGLDAYTPADFTDDRDFLDKLLMERAHELFFEGCRRQDLIRDGSYVSAMKQKCSILGETTAINENHHRIPLPQSVITEGQGKINQNPGY